MWEWGGLARPTAEVLSQFRGDETTPGGARRDQALLNASNPDVF